jgi:peroxiredoxin Q/BCP
MSDNARSSRSSSLETIGQAAAERLPASNHPLLGRPAPDFELNNQDGTRWRLSQHLSEGPVVVVFYLGMTCLACVSHLVEFDSRWDELRDAGAQLVAISPDESNFTRDRFDRFGALAFPALADPERTVAKAYGAWRPNAALSAGEPLHATFLIERNGQVRWAWVGDRPFMDIPAMLLELDQARNDALTTNETRKAQP